MTARNIARDRSPRRMIRLLRKKASPHRKYFFKAGMTLLTVFVVYSFLGSDFGFLNLLRLERRNSSLQNQKLELAAEIVDLEHRLKRLETDSLYIQEIARSRYGLAAKDEILIRIPEETEYQPE